MSSVMQNRGAQEDLALFPVASTALLLWNRPRRALGQVTDP